MGDKKMFNYFLISAYFAVLTAIMSISVIFVEVLIWKIIESIREFKEDQRGKEAARKWEEAKKE